MVASNVQRVQILAPLIELSSSLRVQKSTGVYWSCSSRSRLDQLRILMRTDELFNFCLFLVVFQKIKPLILRNVDEETLIQLCI